ncbi:uncharacterized protein LOC143546019 [Bidens hawaiensis]|uniref:uncharacterized protein LOC143546019 n=1 Tax=Bidens hawaiensis TaxID=980011 RepID=UPI00404B22F1
MFNDETAIDSQGFPVYKRRDDGKYVVKSDIMMDNRTVVPYNKTLLKQFQAHINVEWCNQYGSIKYLFKYINKGPDRATISLVQNNNGDNPNPNLDEIKVFYDCRYVSACEATWRIFSFDVHYRIPFVMRLAFHLPGEKQVIYGANEDIEDILNKTTNASSMFTGWFECRVHAVPPAFDEAYYLRILLNKVRGLECFEDIQTVDGVVCETFRDACYKRGLLDDDKEYIEAIEEASHTSTGYYLRNLFATMLITYSLSRPHFVWESTWQLLVDGLILNEEQLKNLALLEIENFLISNNSSLRRYKQMPFPDMETISRETNPLMVEELSYDTETMNNEFNNLFDSLTDKQRGGVYFVYGYGGTGKTYLWKTLSASIKSKGEVVLNVASSGIASLLLEGGRTVKGNTDVYELLKKTCLIIWDEAPMFHKHAFEALDRTLNDVMNGDSANKSEPVRALLAPLNEVVQEINERMLDLFPCEEVEYLSSDSLAECEDLFEDFDPQL